MVGIENQLFFFIFYLCNVKNWLQEILTFTRNNIKKNQGSNKAVGEILEENIYNYHVKILLTRIIK